MKDYLKLKNIFLLKLKPMFGLTQMMVCILMYYLVGNHAHKNTIQDNQKNFLMLKWPHRLMIPTLILKVQRIN